jgi:chitodextrinase
MYLNYDGAGSRFGDVGVRATSADQSKLAVYGAQRTADGARTIMVINKTADDLTSTLTIPYSGSGFAPQAQVWRYSAANLNAITREADVNVLPPPPVFPPGPSVIPATYPANSITLLVLPGTTGPDTEKPTPPGAPVATDITTTSFTASWAPSTDNVGVTRYMIVASQGDRVWQANSTTTSATVTGLSPGSTYLVAVHAFDAAGNVSDASPQTTIRTLTPPDTTPPTAPGQPTVTNVTSSSFTATWTPSTDNASAVRYEVWLTYLDTVSRVGSTTSTSFTVTGLQPNSAYSVSIRAFDAAGNSASSPSTSVSTPPNGTGCVATYRIVNSWPGGFQAEVTVRNTGSTTLNGWTVRWPYPAGVSITQLWNGTLVSNAPSVVVRNAPWNGSVGVGQTVTFGFLGRQSSPHVPPVLTCTSP